MVGGFVNLLTFLLDSPRISIRDLIPKEDKMSPLIPFFNESIALAFALILLISQFASRIYISFRPNHHNFHGNSKELVSDSVLVITIAIRILSNGIYWIWQSESFHIKVYSHCFNVNIITPLVILLCHQKAREYFGKMNPRFKNFILRFNKSNPEDEAQTNSDQESPASNVGETQHSSQQRVQVRIRSNSFQSESCLARSPSQTMKRSFSYPCLAKAKDVPKVIEINESANAVYSSKSKETTNQKGKPIKESHKVMEMPAIEID